jgi:hypothetical protein
VIRRLFAGGRKGPRAACRLLQPNRSTSTTGNESLEPRAPRRWSPTVAALPAGGYAGPSRREPPFGGPVAGARPVESSRVRGLRPGCCRPALPRTPPIAIARDGSFAPTRSARTPLVASSRRRRLEFPVAPGRSFPRAPFLTSLPGVRRLRNVRLSDIDRLAADRHPLGPPHALLREERRVPLHPRCLPSPEPPLRVEPFRPQAVPNLWTEGWRLFNLRAAQAFDEATGVLEDSLVRCC